VDSVERPFAFVPTRPASQRQERLLRVRKLVQRSWQDNDGNKRQTVEILVTHVGPDLQFATAEVAKSTAEGLGSASDKGSSADEKQSAMIFGHIHRLTG
jgi:single-stranded DNA-binding protein